MRRPSRSAWSMSRPSAARRSSHCRAAAQPVIDREHERPVAGDARGRIEQRMRQRQDDDRRQHHAQQDEPERRLRRRLLARHEIEQQPQRRKADAPRRRRRHAQQPPQDRQHREAGEQPRRGEGSEPSSAWRDPPHRASPSPQAATPYPRSGDCAPASPISSSAAAPARRRARGARCAAAGRCGGWRSSSAAPRAIAASPSRWRCSRSI